MAIASIRIQGALPLFRPSSEQAGAFVVEPQGPDHVRLVMREPHFANNVRYVLDVRRRNGELHAFWLDAEDGTPTGPLEIGRA